MRCDNKVLNGFGDVLDPLRFITWKTKDAHCPARHAQGTRMNGANLIVAIAVSVVLFAGAEAQTPQTGAAIEADLFGSPAQGGVRRWQVAPDVEVSLHRTPSAEAVAIATLPGDAILSNFGCSVVAEQIWCEVRPFRGGARGFALAEALLPARGPDGVVAMGLDDSKRRARRKKFDATGAIPCAQEQGQELGRCGVGVSRGDGGDATVVATFANGFSRLLFFVHGEFVSANPTMSGAGTDTDWRVETGRHYIRVDDQRFEIPIDLLFGG
ncbi:MAG: hypothetical protein QNJ44_12750 [Rhodobacter sp.]|nr:hypothetical protein [Rhodobacter sp.]